MVFAIAVLATLATSHLIWLIRTATVDERARSDACLALLPFVAAMAMVAHTFVWLSPHPTSARLQSATLAELREIEGQIPRWALMAGDLAPPWLALLVGLLGFAIVCYSFERQVIMPVASRFYAVAKWYATVMQWVGALLGAACCFTLFGDGVKDVEGDIRGEIHEVRMRLSATQDTTVHALASAIAHQVTTTILSQADTDARTLVAARANFVGAVAITEKKWKRKASGIQGIDNAIEPRDVLTILAKIPWDEDPTILADRVARSRGLSEPPSVFTDFEWIPLDLSTFPRAAMEVRRRSEQSRGGPVDEGTKNASKELIAYGFAAAKEVIASDPAMGFFFDSMAVPAAEMLKTVAGRKLLEPALNKVWRARAVGIENREVETQAKALVKHAPVRPWVRLPAAREADLALAAKYEAAARELIRPASPQIDRNLLNEEHRRLLVELLKRLHIPEISESLSTSFRLTESRTALQEIDDYRLLERQAITAVLIAASGNMSKAKEKFYDVAIAGTKGSVLRASFPKSEVDRVAARSGKVTERPHPPNRATK